MDAPQQTPAPILGSKEALEMRVRAAERAHDQETVFGKSANDAAVKSGEEALRAMILINGGSSVAMLAFIGTMASKDLVAPTQLDIISAPLICFAGGLVAAMIATAGAYFTNLMIAGSSNRKQREYEQPFVRPTRSSRIHNWFGEVFRYVAILAAAGSIVCFAWGVIKANSAFGMLSKPKSAQVRS
ncbi:hypothetical protein [Bradyrhizobium sp. RP6]|uniref:hypothetical protein n=1 Tax=Bradyrhizobium sp. RP6 TaxID=2489596 RepID=UPI000F53DA0C|nr:hypothetical protein [Bradyrhizobium sp. RP6]RQH15708.1 hypothetical protein EHH60_00475 [Bradyrhizobium sp. RP6]